MLNLNSLTYDSTFVSRVQAAAGRSRSERRERPACRHHRTLCEAIMAKTERIIRRVVREHELEFNAPGRLEFELEPT